MLGVFKGQLSSGAMLVAGSLVSAAALPNASVANDPVVLDSDWITGKDLPPELPAGTYTLTVKTTIAPSGRVDGCVVSAPSGVPGIDDNACRLVLQRARFKPAHDAQGKAVAGAAETSFKWEVKKVTPQPVAATAPSANLKAAPSNTLEIGTYIAGNTGVSPIRKNTRYIKTYPLGDPQGQAWRVSITSRDNSVWMEIGPAKKWDQMLGCAGGQDVNAIERSKYLPGSEVRVYSGAPTDFVIKFEPMSPDGIADEAAVMRSLSGKTFGGLKWKGGQTVVEWGPWSSSGIAVTARELTGSISGTGKFSASGLTLSYSGEYPSPFNGAKAGETATTEMSMNVSDFDTVCSYGSLFYDWGTSPGFSSLRRTGPNRYQVAKFYRTWSEPKGYRTTRERFVELTAQEASVFMAQHTANARALLAANQAQAAAESNKGPGIFGALAGMAVAGVLTNGNADAMIDMARIAQGGEQAQQAYEDLSARNAEASERARQSDENLQRTIAAARQAPPRTASPPLSTTTNRAPEVAANTPEAASGSSQATGPARLNDTSTGPTKEIPPRGRPAPAPVVKKASAPAPTKVPQLAQKKPAVAVAWSEGIVACRPSGKGKDVFCRGPLQTTFFTPGGSYEPTALGAACGSSRDIRRLNDVGGYMIYACGFGIHPTDRNYPGNTDVAAKLGLGSIPGTRTYRCVTSKDAYCFDQ